MVSQRHANIGIFPSKIPILSSSFFYNANIVQPDSSEVHVVCMAWNCICHEKYNQRPLSMAAMPGDHQIGFDRHILRVFVIYG